MDHTELSRPPGPGALAIAAARQLAGKRRGEFRRQSAHAPLSVDPARHAAFSRAVGAGVSDALHPGYLHALVFPLVTWLLTRPDAPFPAAGIVHLSNEVTLEEPVCPGEELHGVALLERLEEHHAGTVVVARAEIYQAGRRVFRETAEYLARGVWLAGHPDRPERPEFVPPEPTATIGFGPRDNREYARASGDWNPIHLSRAAARLGGMRQPIVHGMNLASRLASMGGAALKRPHRWRVEFGAPVPMPGTVAARVAPAGDGVELLAWRPPRRGRPARPHVTGFVTELAEVEAQV